MPELKRSSTIIAPQGRMGTPWTKIRFIKGFLGRGGRDYAIKKESMGYKI
jgi:hypothetical protein